jgi:TfoX/Sxy family transcriptional regulator of competence genes
MAIDQRLCDDLRDHLASLDAVQDVEERSMFGGVGFMWRGNLLCGLIGDELLIRVDKTTSASLLGEDGAHPMVMGSRTSQGWIQVPVPLDQRELLLARWVGRAVAYAASLPAK